jgi:phospholipase/carboxylesterase
MTTQALKDNSLLPKGPTKPDAVVVFLHGYGADGRDLLGLAPECSITGKDIAFHAPNAPFPCEMSPFGHQWFSLSSYDPNMLRRNPETLNDGLAALYQGAVDAAPILNHYIDSLLTRHSISADKLFLIGFSQGTMMALHTALRRTTPVAAVIGFSGALLGADHLSHDIKSRPPVHLIHGTADEVVPFQAMAHAEAALMQMNVPVQTLSCPMLGHGIDHAGIQKARTVLHSQLA